MSFMTWRIIVLFLLAFVTGGGGGGGVRCNCLPKRGKFLVVIFQTTVACVLSFLNQYVYLQWSGNRQLLSEC